MAAGTMLTEEAWIHSSSRRDEWERANRMRAERMWSDLRAATRQLSRRFPALLASLQLRPSLVRFLRTPAAAAPTLASHPALRGWLFYAQSALERPAGEAGESAPLLGQFHGFAAALAALRGDSLEIRASLDYRGHFHLHGLRCYLDLGADRAFQQVLLRFRRGDLTVALPGGVQARARRDVLLEGCRSPMPGRQGPGVADLGGCLLRWHPAVTLTMELDDCDPLLLVSFKASSHPDRRQACGPQSAQSVGGRYSHQVAALLPPEKERFVSVLRESVRRIADSDPHLCRELLDCIRVVVPLARPAPRVHVSSTYSHLRGAVGLCHDEDPLVQAETLVHEFCHNKLNTLMELDPLLDPGGPDAAKPVYYSPWRIDPRPLRGLFLGAHAFLNVARFLAAAAGGASDPKAARRLQVNAARRCLQVDLALRALSGHGRYTELGRRFVLGLHASLMEAYGRLPKPPTGIWGAAREPVEEHLRRYGLYPSAYHNQAAP